MQMKPTKYYPIPDALTEPDGTLTQPPLYIPPEPKIIGDDMSGLSRLQIGENVIYAQIEGRINEAIEGPYKVVGQNDAWFSPAVDTSMELTIVSPEAEQISSIINSMGCAKSHKVSICFAQPAREISLRGCITTLSYCPDLNRVEIVFRQITDFTQTASVAEPEVTGGFLAPILTDDQVAHISEVLEKAIAIHEGKLKPKPSKWPVAYKAEWKIMPPPPTNMKCVLKPISSEAGKLLGYTTADDTD